MNTDHDTIVAPATAAGGAIAVIRISGGEAFAVCDRIFRGRRPLAEADGYTVHYGTIAEGDRVIDDVLAAVFRAPHSYTGENSVEISCHGSSYIVSEILRLLIAAGGRMAQPGEFTIRAYLAGKLDLSQAEAVADMIASSSRAAHALASTQMRGGYSEELESLREKLLNLTSLLELELDFSEEDVEFADRTALRATMQRIAAEIDRLRSSFALGNAIREGVAVAIAGAPNVGKSTLINHLVGEKIAIVSHKPQTTRNRICGIVTHDDTQLVFVDTPGFHKPRTRLGDYMNNVVHDSVSDVDAALLLVEPIAHIGPQEEELLGQLRAAHAPVILVINKIDTVEKENLLAVIAAYAAKFEFDAVVPVSAKFGDGIPDLLRECARHAADSPFLFPDDMTTDQPERQVMAEIIREKLLWNLEREIPHGTAVEITKFSERDSGVIDIDATIYCEKASHKGIIIGKNGSMLKKISTEAREDCERFMGTKVFLQTWVKVKENWRDSQAMIRNFGYE